MKTIDLTQHNTNFDLDASSWIAQNSEWADSGMAERALQIFHVVLLNLSSEAIESLPTQKIFDFCYADAGFSVKEIIEDLEDQV